MLFGKRLAWRVAQPPEEARQADHARSLELRHRPSIFSNIHDVVHAPIEEGAGFASSWSLSSSSLTLAAVEA